jgi:DNA-binding PadR family transcriptional regulator
MLMLRTLLAGSAHASGIAASIERISRWVLKVNPGSLIPALHQLERIGYLDGEWRATNANRRAKYYEITDLGRKKLSSEMRNWKSQPSRLARIASRGC